MIAYENEPEATEELTIKEMKWILDNHSIQYRYINNVLHAELCYSKDQKHYKEWVQPAKTYGALMIWLGY